MQERDDYVDHDRPPPRLLVRLSRRRWLWLALLVGVNLVGAGVWHFSRPSSRSSYIKVDPIEDNPAVRPFLQLADQEAEAELATCGIGQEFGSCHTFWHTKKRILKEKYGIDWRTPAEMNPHIAFD
jgi:hypothetical protein